MCNPRLNACFLIIFLCFCGLLRGHDPTEKSDAEKRLDNKHKMLDYMKKAKEQWVFNQRATTNVLYDSNTNLAPKDAPTTTRSESFIGVLNYNALAYHLFYKTSVTAGVDAEYKYYTRSQGLNTGMGNIFGKVQYFLSDTVQMGSSLKFTGNYQPKVVDASNLILAQSFSYFGTNLTPYISYLPSRTWKLELIFNVDRKWYTKSQKPGEFPYDDLVLQADASVEKAWESYKVKLKTGYTHDKFFQLPAFDLFTLLSLTHKKTLNIWFAKLEHSFPKFYLPFVFYMEGGITKDTFQGYENYVYFQPSLNIRIPMGEDNKKMLVCYLNYQRRQYTKRKTLSSFFRAKTHYNIVQTVLQYDHQISKKLSYFEMVSYESRITNEHIGRADRSYQKFTVGVGVNYAF